MSDSNFSLTVENYLNKAGGKWEETVTTVGDSYSKAEEDLMKAYSLSDENKAEVDKLAGRLGAAKGTSLNALQQLAAAKFQKMERVMLTLQKLLESSHEMMMQIIRKIGGQ